MQKTIIQEQLSVYLAASAARKTASLDHVCFTSGMQRKAAIRAFAREQHRSGWKAPPRLGRPRLYTAETEAALAFVWEQYDYPSGELLHGAIAEAIRIFIRDDMWPYSAAATQQLRDT